MKINIPLVNIIVLILAVGYLQFNEAHAQVYAKPILLKDGIETATLKEACINEKVIRAMEDSIHTGKYTNIHSVLLLKNNKLVYENYWAGYDVVRGKGYVGSVAHHRDSVHDIRSITKSVVGTAVLIALSQGIIKSLNQSIFDFFSEYSTHNTETKNQITIQHLLNMTPGLEWDEEIPYTDPKNSETMMSRAEDPIEFVLSQKLVSAPGLQYRYSGGCTQLLASIIENASGMSINKFVEQFLFKELGIERYSWAQMRTGKYAAASGLRLTSRDMAKIGLLFLNDGQWLGKLIIPLHLIAHTLQSQATTTDTTSTILFAGYSNQFWIYTQNIKSRLVNYIQCQGNGGQIILIDKKHDLVMVVTAGNYNQRGLRKSSYDIYPDFVYPAVMNIKVDTKK
jgi:CubicO group peptidase (beta-lactamase class C family)